MTIDEIHDLVNGYAARLQMEPPPRSTCSRSACDRASADGPPNRLPP